MNEFRNRVISPIDPWRVKHIEQHWVIGIRCHGNLDDPAGLSVQPRNRKVMREFIASRRGHQERENLSYKKDKNSKQKTSTDQIRRQKGAKKCCEKKTRRGDKTGS